MQNQLLTAVQLCEVESKVSLKCILKKSSINMVNT